MIVLIQELQASATAVRFRHQRQGSNRSRIQLITSRIGQMLPIVSNISRSRRVALHAPDSGIHRGRPTPLVTHTSIAIGNENSIRSDAYTPSINNHKLGEQHTAGSTRRRQPRRQHPGRILRRQHQGRWNSKSAGNNTQWTAPNRHDSLLIPGV